MKGLKKDLENSFVLALQSQSQTFENSLNDIKALLMDNKRKSPAVGDASMEED